MAMKYESRNSGYEDSFEVGSAFQDFVCIELAKQHIILQNINSKKFQYNVGENLQGFEIKLDTRFNGYTKTPTGRLSIEFEEKQKGTNQVFALSGIYRNDNSWLYIQGNPWCFYIFDKRVLQRLHKRKDKDGNPFYETAIWPPSNPTVKKFYLPIEDADKFCIKKVEPNGGTQSTENSILNFDTDNNSQGAHNGIL